MFLVHEIFASVQGEGVRTGLPTVFVRLAGCNLGCVWCDTEFASSETGSHRMTEDEILESVRVHGIRNVCITGGEPFCHEGLSEMVSLLLSEGYDVDIETNGSFDVSGLLEVCPGVFLSMDVKTPSSRMEGSFEMANLDHMRPSDQLKFIISGEDDMDFALEFITKNVPSCHLVLTPCDNAGGRRIVESLMNELSNAYERGDSERMRLLSSIRIMLQMHKVMWGNVRGV